MKKSSFILIIMTLFIVQNANSQDFDFYGIKIGMSIEQLQELCGEELMESPDVDLGYDIAAYLVQFPQNLNIARMITFMLHNNELFAFEISFQNSNSIRTAAIQDMISKKFEGPAQSGGLSELLTPTFIFNSTWNNGNISLTFQADEAGSEYGIYAPYLTITDDTRYMSILKVIQNEFDK